MSIALPLGSSSAYTLLQIAQEAMSEIAIPAPVSLFGNPDQQANQILGLLQREGRELSDMSSNTQGWTELRKEHTFNLSPNLEGYPYPTDLKWFIFNTQWDRSYRWRLAGPLDAAEWQTLKSGLSQVGPRLRFRIMGGMIYFNPIPQSTDSIVMEYISSQWCTSANGVGQTKWQNDTDLPVLKPDLFIMGLKWRFLRAKGLDYEQEYTDYRNAVDRALARSGSARTLRMNETRYGNFHLLSNNQIPDSGFGQ